MKKRCWNSHLPTSANSAISHKQQANKRMAPKTRFRNYLSIRWSSQLAFFIAGFLTSSIFNFAAVKIKDASTVIQQPPSPICPSMNGIYPLMRDFQCGHGNMQTPRVLREPTKGRGRFVVDIGLDDGKETLDAVQSGFVVFGFEMLTGSITKIRSNAADRGISDRVHFVEFVYDKDKGYPVAKDLPPPPTDGKGFAYIFNAGVSDTMGAMAANGEKSAAGHIENTAFKQAWSAGMVPILRLDQLLPPWIDRIFFLKIDTQGHELKVLNGATKYIHSGLVQYVQYEFSPKLMRKAVSGDPLELLNLMVSMGAICFDMMGEHHELTRPSKPLDAYYRSLNNGRLSPYLEEKKKNIPYRGDPFGPWDDILCFFPDATN